MTSSGIDPRLSGLQHGPSIFMPTARGVAKRSPIQVLTTRHAAPLGFIADGAGILGEREPSGEHFSKLGLFDVA
jgi:hypothetical protein